MAVIGWDEAAQGPAQATFVYGVSLLSCLLTRSERSKSIFGVGSRHSCTCRLAGPFALHVLETRRRSVIVVLYQSEKIVLQS